MGLEGKWEEGGGRGEGKGRLKVRKRERRDGGQYRDSAQNAVTRFYYIRNCLFLMNSCDGF